MLQLVFQKIKKIKSLLNSLILSRVWRVSDAHFRGLRQVFYALSDAHLCDFAPS